MEKDYGYWKGARIQDMSKEQLLEIIEELGRMLADMRQRRDEYRDQLERS